MQYRIAAIALLGLATIAVPASAQSVTKKKTIAGHYKCSGEGYEAQVVIRQMTDETFRVYWNLGVVAQVGSGIRKSDTLSVGYAGVGHTGIIVYDIEEKKLTGKYCTLPGDWKLRTETLTFVGPLRSWELGDKVLANRSSDGLWHPATVAEKEGEEYVVTFADGNESVTSSRIAADNINVGYTVLTKQGPQDAYLAGQVVRRDGETLDLQLPNGKTVTTKLTAIALLTLGGG